MRRTVHAVEVARTLQHAQVLGNMYVLGGAGRQESGTRHAVVLDDNCRGSILSDGSVARQVIRGQEADG